VVGLFLLCGWQLFLSLLPSSVPRVHSPPYIPALAHELNVWTDKTEIVVSDQPWAIAWYADRKSLWMPAKLTDFAKMSDYQTLGAPFAGLFLSPITSHARLMQEIAKGEYKDWAQVILRSPGPNFPFKELAPMLDGDYLFYSDRRRWERTSK
jgi:hypothetical protein